MGLCNASEALDAFAKGMSIEKDSMLRGALRDAARRMTREELAAWLLRALDTLQTSGAVLSPQLEDVTDAEKLEAMFRHIQSWQRDKPAPGDYCDYVALWSETPWSSGAPASCA
jgi:hypothetical protein